jgi:Immunoglobulin domain
MQCKSASISCKTSRKFNDQSIKIMKSPIKNLILTSLIFFIIICSGVVNAANVLVNPGAETGDSTGWVFDAKASVASTNDFNYNGGQSFPPTASNVLAHTGEYVFKTYQDFANASTRIYQDIATSAGSQWTASCFALSHAQDYISVPCSAHLQVVFYDNLTNALAVYGSQILDPTAEPLSWTIVPPMAVDASGWLDLIVTNSFSSDPATEGNFSGVVNPPLVAPAGTAFVRYQLEFDDSSGGGGSMFWDDCVLNKVVGSDPDIVTPPTSQTAVVGQNATFTVVGSGSTTLSYHWQNSAGPLSNSSKFSGVTTSSLTISNLLLVDANNYSVVVTDANGSLTSVPVKLTVLNPAAAANALGANAGFENGVWSPWNPFVGANIDSTNGFYFQTTTPINVFDGEFCAQVYDGGTDNGFWQDISLTPGSVWKATAWAYITSGPDNLSASNSCRVQVWFKNSSGTQVGPTYESFKVWGLALTNVFPMLPRDTWVQLPLTNVVDNTDTPTNSVQDFVAPPGATALRYQVYYNGTGPTGGSVFWDDMQLYQLIPVTVTASVSGSTYNISFLTKGGSSYSVLFKNSLTDPTWSVLASNIPGTGAKVTVSDTISTHNRFYLVQTQ